MGFEPLPFPPARVRRAMARRAREVWPTCPRGHADCRTPNFCARVAADEPTETEES